MGEKGEFLMEGRDFQRVRMGRWLETNLGRTRAPIVAAHWKWTVISEDWEALRLSKESHALRMAYERQTPALQEATATVDNENASTDHDWVDTGGPCTGSRYLLKLRSVK